MFLVSAFGASVKGSRARVRSGGGQKWKRDRLGQVMGLREYTSVIWGDKEGKGTLQIRALERW